MSVRDISRGQVQHLIDFDLNNTNNYTQDHLTYFCI